MSALCERSEQVFVFPSRLTEERLNRSQLSGFTSTQTRHLRAKSHHVGDRTHSWHHFSCQLTRTGQLWCHCEPVKLQPLNSPRISTLFLCFQGTSRFSLFLCFHKDPSMTLLSVRSYSIDTYPFIGVWREKWPKSTIAVAVMDVDTFPIQYSRDRRTGSRWKLFHLLCKYTQNKSYLSWLKAGINVSPCQRAYECRES